MAAPGLELFWTYPVKPTISTLWNIEKCATCVVSGNCICSGPFFTRWENGSIIGPAIFHQWCILKAFAYSWALLAQTTNSRPKDTSTSGHGSQEREVELRVCLESGWGQNVDKTVHSSNFYFCYQTCFVHIRLTKKNPWPKQHRSNCKAKSQNAKV